MPGVVVAHVVAADAAVACVVVVPYAEPGIDAAADKLFEPVPAVVVELHVPAAYAEPAFFVAALSVVAAYVEIASAAVAAPAFFPAGHVGCVAAAHVALASFPAAEPADAALVDYAAVAHVGPASAVVAGHVGVEPAGCVAAAHVEQPASSTVAGGQHCFLPPVVALELYD